MPPGNLWFVACLGVVVGPEDVCCILPEFNQLSHLALTRNARVVLRRSIWELGVGVWYDVGWSVWVVLIVFSRPTSHPLEVFLVVGREGWHALYVCVWVAQAVWAITLEVGCASSSILRVFAQACPRSGFRCGEGSTPCVAVAWRVPLRAAVLVAGCAGSLVFPCTRA